MKKKNLLKTAIVALSAVVVAGMLGSCGSSSSSNKELLDKVVSNGELTVVMNMGNAPWTYKDKKTGEYSGMAVDLIKGYCKQLGVKCNIKTMKFESMIPAINSGKGDIICTNLSRTVERSQNVMFTDTVGVDYGVVIVKKGTYSKLSQINKKGVTLTTESGSAFEGIVKDVFPKATMKTVDTTPNAFQAVKSGRADGFVTDLSIAEPLVASDSSMEIVKEYCYTDPMAFAVDNSYLSSSFINSFNSYLQNIKANGTYAKIYKKWIGSTWKPNATESSL